MKPKDRQEWICKYIDDRDISTNYRYYVDILDLAFVDSYIAATNAKFSMVFYGASKCPQLGRDLSAMFADGLLKRRIVGIDGLAGQGFPKWVWQYTTI